MSWIKEVTGSEKLHEDAMTLADLKDFLRESAARGRMFDLQDFYGESLVGFNVFGWQVATVGFSATRLVGVNAKNKPINGVVLDVGYHNVGATAVGAYDEGFLYLGVLWQDMIANATNKTWEVLDYEKSNAR